MVAAELYYAVAYLFSATTKTLRLVLQPQNQERNYGHRLWPLGLIFEHSNNMLG
jgi:hypothetical protein